MAMICSSQKLLAYRCKLVADRVRVLTNLLGPHPTLAPLEEVVNGIIEMATCQLFLASRTIHTANNPWMATTEFLPNFPRLASVLSCSLNEATKVLTTVLTDAHILDSLEILPMCLRRNYEQLKNLFFSRSVDSIHEPYKMIRDVLGRCFWETKFGNKNCVLYTVFQETLFSTWRSSFIEGEEEMMGDVLRFLLNFPEDDLVTPHKWDLFLGQWGSFANLLNNIRMIALRPGFLGIMNGHQAEELLTSFTDDCALIRFSSSAKTLSIAYTSRSMIKHERKPPMQDLQLFFQSTLKGKTMVPVSLQWERLRQLKTLEDWLRTPMSSLYLNHERAR